MVLRQVQDQLESEGFEVQCFLIPASGIGAWHQRYRVWIVGHSQHNGLLAAEKRCRDEKDYGGSQKRENETIEPTRASGSRDNEDVSNTNTRLGIGENEKVQARRKAIDSSSSRGGEENVSNTEVIGTRESRNTDQEKRNESSGSTQSNSSGKDVSDTNSGLRGRGTTIGESGENKVWRFYSEEEEQARVDIWSETVGRNAVFGEGETDVSQSNDERRKESDISQKSEEQIIDNRGHDEKRDISDTGSKRLQRRDPERELQEQELGFSSNQNDETKQTWWQIESELCGVPNGISYELDKDRANRIKTLGNAIVPQIAREFGLAIKKVLSDEDII
jgi:DNA (cytosine-5)-methyltransferase 1